MALAGFLTATCASALPRWKERCLALEGRTVTLEEAARELPTRRAECLVALEPAGDDLYRVTGAWTGAHSAVDVPEDDSGLLAGAVTLHNHPAMTPELSSADFMMAVRYDAAAVCLAWRTGLGGALSRQHVVCLTQDEALAELMARVPIEELRAMAEEAGTP